MPTQSLCCLTLCYLAHAALILRLLSSCTPNARILVLASDAHYPGRDYLEKYPPGLQEVNE